MLEGICAPPLRARASHASRHPTGPSDGAANGAGLQAMDAAARWTAQRWQAPVGQRGTEEAKAEPAHPLASQTAADPPAIGTDRLHIDASVEWPVHASASSKGRMGVLSSAALAAEALMEAARVASSAGAQDARAASRFSHAQVADRCPMDPRIVGQVVGRMCDVAQKDRLRACLAVWTLLVDHRAARHAPGTNGAEDHHARAPRPPVRPKAEVQLPFQAWLLWLRERRRAKSRNAHAVGILSRRDRAAFLHECFTRWHASAAERHALQVRMMRERLERADAECCSLRSQEETLHSEAQRWRAEAETAQAKTDWAEAELLRRSGHEFARLRDLQVELAKLQAEVALPKASTCTCNPCHTSQVALNGERAMLHVPQNRAEPLPPSHTAANLLATRLLPASVVAARGVAMSFAARTTRLWLKLYLSAWCAQASTRGLVLALVVQCAAAEDAAQCLRALATWRFVADRKQILRAAMRLLDTTSIRQAVPLARVAFRRWHSVVGDFVGAMTNSFDAGSPLSRQTYCSAVVWSPAEKALTEAFCSTAASGSGTGETTNGSSIEDGAAAVPHWPSANRPQLGQNSVGSGPAAQRPWAEGLWIRPQQREGALLPSAPNTTQAVIWPPPAPAHDR